MSGAGARSAEVSAPTAGWAARPSQCAYEFFRSDVGLSEQARESAGLEFCMHWDYTTPRALAYNDVATALSNLVET